jgi:hypothetical protein
MTLEEEEEHNTTQGLYLSLSLSCGQNPQKCTKKYGHFGFPFPGDDGIKNVKREKDNLMCDSFSPTLLALSFSLFLSLVNNILFFIAKNNIFL